MRRILFLIRVSRPIIWFVLPTVYALGLHAAHAETSAAAIVQLLLLTFPLNVVGCGLNDIYDFESDRLSARRAKIWGVVVDEKTRPLVWRTAIAMTPVILSGSLFTANVWNIAATAGLLATAWAYSVPPVRFKERPPLDSLTNGVGYFLLPFVMGYSLGENPANMPFRYYLLALCVAGIHALAAAADYDVDLAAGHRTIAVVFGKRVAAGFSFAAFLTAALVGGYESTAVRAYLAIGAVAALLAAVLPKRAVISAACVTIFAGFALAAALYLVGI
jgi:4-hydroxybenzoate polyprenyltransferase